MSELDQAIAEHARVAQELRSQSSGDSAAALLQLRNELQGQVDHNGGEMVDKLRIEEVARGIPLSGWVPASIRWVVGQSAQDTPVQTLVKRP